MLAPAIESAKPALRASNSGLKPLGVQIVRPGLLSSARERQLVVK